MDRSADRGSPPHALDLNIGAFYPQRGATLQERLGPWDDWLNARRRTDVWSLSRIMRSVPGDHVLATGETDSGERRYVNFASQDYLSLSSDPDVIAAAVEACSKAGLHSAGSAIVAGRTGVLVNLEQLLAATLSKESCLTYPTGWAAGFGVLAGLARASDSILLDKLAHSCLKEGAAHSRARLSYFAHNDVDQLEVLLRAHREQDARNAIFVVIESLYSMDSDSPPLSRITALARRHGAIVVLDVAHDFGSMGETGLGALETVPRDDWPDVIMGSFSKTFASNGGFVAATKSVIDYLRCFSASFTFSNALSPLQAAVVTKCHEIVFSASGAVMRRQLMENVERLRNAMTEAGHEVGGSPSPIVPVFAGSEPIARLTAKHLDRSGVLANLAEYPAVPVGKARFRFQVMRSHTTHATREAVLGFSAACESAREEYVAIGPKPANACHASR